MSGHHWQTIGDTLLGKIATAYVRDGSVHWPTVTSILAGLAGEYALLSSGVKLPEGGVVQSDEVTELVFSKARGGSLYGYSEILAEQAYGISAEYLPGYNDTLGQVGFKLLPGNYPDYLLPANLIPRTSPLNAAPMHRAEVNKIASETSTDLRGIAFSLMTASMKSVGFVDEVLMRDMTALALQSLVVGSRFVPSLEPSPEIASGGLSDMIDRLKGGTITPPGLVERPVEEEAAAPSEEIAEPARGFGRRR